MGCNCKVTKNILDIHKKYGFNTKVSWKYKSFSNIKKYFLYFSYLMLLCFITPIGLVWFIYFLIKGKGFIDFNKVFKKFVR